MKTFPQIPLPIFLPDDETFDSFYVGKNSQLVFELKNSLQDPAFECIYFWSNKPAGKTHLLHAACSVANQKNQFSCYLSLNDSVQISPQILQEFENYSLICLDNIHAIAGNKEWEIAIFNLFNQLRELSNVTLLISANTAPRNVNFDLPDLASRLDWGKVYHLHSLSDEEKVLALQLRARLRGFSISDEVGNYLIHHVSRDTKNIFLLLEQLDKASIASKRKLTIPFVKAFLSI